jgi:hypothetical protein
LRFTAILKKFYRGNNTITWLRSGKENAILVVAQATGPSDAGVEPNDAGSMTLLYCRESLL